MRARSWALSLFLGAVLWSGTALAIEPGEMLKDQRLEERARTIDRELRCLVCQNENIDDSNADLAHDLRLLVRKRIIAGDSDEQVKQYIVARYGNYVLLKPPFDAETYLLWFGPALLLLSAAGIAVYFYRRSPAFAAEPPLTAEEARRVAALIGDDDNRDV
jgi:cytochrome c-type biogenesis protein CcmH